MKTLGTKIKFLRKNKKISLATLGKEINVSDVAIMKWENNRSEPTATNIQNLAKFFNVSADYLLGLENEDYTKNYDIENVLSTEQYQLLNNFNRLDKRKQSMVQAYVEAMLEIENKEQQVGGIKYGK